MTTSWKREKAFCALLSAAKERLTRGGLKELTEIALRDHRRCYKHVIAFIQRLARDASQEQRMNLLYVLIDILLAAQKRLGQQNRYRQRLEAAPSTPFALFADCPSDKVNRVISWLAKSHVFSDQYQRRIEESLRIRDAVSKPPPELTLSEGWPFGEGRDGYALKCRVFPEDSTVAVWERICEGVARESASHVQP